KEATATTTRFEIGVVLTARLNGSTGCRRHLANSTRRPTHATRDSDRARRPTPAAARGDRRAYPQLHAVQAPCAGVQGEAPGRGDGGRDSLRDRRACPRGR